MLCFSFKYLLIISFFSICLFLSLDINPSLYFLFSLIFKKFPLQKSAAKPLQVPQNYLSSAPYVGSGAPSSMYLGVPPYGSSLFNGSAIPPYDIPFSGGSAYHYNYGSRLSGGSPYRPLHMPGPPPYSSGSMIGNGIGNLLFPVYNCYYFCCLLLILFSYFYFFLQVWVTLSIAINLPFTFLEHLIIIHSYLQHMPNHPYAYMGDLMYDIKYHISKLLIILFQVECMACLL